MAVACTQTRRTRCPKVSRTRPDIMPSQKVVWPSHCRPCAYRLPLCTHGTASRFTYSLRGQMLVASQEACRVARNASPTRCCTRAPPARCRRHPASNHMDHAYVYGRMRLSHSKQQSTAPQAGCACHGSIRSSAGAVLAPDDIAMHAHTIPCSRRLR